MPSLILTLVGPDRPGLVNALAAHVAASGGSWQESRMARMAGQFAGILRVEIPSPAAIDAAVSAMKAEGFSVVMQDADAIAASAHPLIVLTLTGLDRPGIVRDVTRVLAERGVNIEVLTTNVESGSFSGETMFRASARLRLPAALSSGAIREALEHLGPEFMVDVEPAEG